MKRRLYLLLLVSLLLSSVQAQQDMSLFGLEETGQSVISNPAALPQKHISVGIPFLSGVSAEVALSGFKVNDLLVERVETDSLYLDIDHVISLLGPKNLSSVQLRNDLLFAGFRLEDDYVSFGLSSNFSAAFHYPAELINLIWKGNATYSDQLLDFSETRLQMNHYLAYHIGYSKKINDKLRIGARLKYLQGLSNAGFEKFSLQFIQLSDPAEYKRFWFNTDVVINTSGVQWQEGVNFAAYFQGKKNPGYALDLGVFYQINKKLSISASVVDVGKITWQTNTRQFGSSAEGYFEGISLDVHSDSIDYYNDFVDSLKTVFNFNERKTAYTTSLPARYAIAASYALNERSELVFLSGITDFSGFAEPYLRLSYAHRLNDRFLIRGSYGIKNRTYGNFGLGAVVNVGPLQIFAFGDNVLGIFSPYNAKMLNANVGVNLVF